MSLSPDAYRCNHFSTSIPRFGPVPAAMSDKIDSDSVDQRFSKDADHKEYGDLDKVEGFHASKKKADRGIFDISDKQTVSGKFENPLVGISKQKLFEDVSIIRKNSHPKLFPDQNFAGRKVLSGFRHDAQAGYDEERGSRCPGTKSLPVDTGAKPRRHHRPGARDPIQMAPACDVVFPDHHVLAGSGNARHG